MLSNQDFRAYRPRDRSPSRPHPDRERMEKRQRAEARSRSARPLPRNRNGHRKPRRRASLAMRRRKDCNHRLRQAHRYHHHGMARITVARYTTHKQRQNRPPILPPPSHPRPKLKRMKRPKSVNATTNSSGRSTRKSRSAEPRCANRKKSRESRSMSPNAPVRKSCKKRVPPPSSASSRMPQPLSPPLNSASCSVLSSTWTHIRSRDELAEEIVGEDENEQRTADEILLFRYRRPRRQQANRLLPCVSRFLDTSISPAKESLTFSQRPRQPLQPHNQKARPAKSPRRRHRRRIKAASKPAPKKTVAKKKTAA